MGGAREAAEGSYSRALALAPRCPPGKILMVIKCPVGRALY